MYIKSWHTCNRISSQLTMEKTVQLVGSLSMKNNTFNNNNLYNLIIYVY